MNHGRRRYATLFAAFLLVLLLRVVIAQDPFKQVTAWLAKPIQGAISKVAYDAPDETDDSESTNLALESQVAELQRQNQTLRSSLNFVTDVRYQTRGAEVIGKSVQSYRKSVTINAGSSQGIAPDMAVLAGDQLVGVVHSVQTNTATVLLLGDPDFRATVTVEGTDIAGIISSAAGGPVVDELSVSETKIDGARVLTNGLGGLFPPGIPAGTIGDQLSTEKDVFKTYALRSNIPTNSLKYVVVVTGYESAP